MMPEPGEGPAKSDSKQRRTQFQPGQSGNPKGRPAGSRSKATILLQAMIEGEGEAVVRAMVDAAKGGDVAAGRALLDRLVPPSKSRPVRIELPPIEAPGDVTKAIGAILDEVAGGNITPDEGAAVAGLVELKRRAIETTDLESRIARLESLQKEGGR